MHAQNDNRTRRGGIERRTVAHTISMMTKSTGKGQGKREQVVAGRCTMQASRPRNRTNMDDTDRRHWPTTEAKAIAKSRNTVSRMSKFADAEGCRGLTKDPERQWLTMCTATEAKPIGGAKKVGRRNGAVQAKPACRRGETWASSGGQKAGVCDETSGNRGGGGVAGRKSQKVCRAQPPDGIWWQSAGSWTWAL